MGRPDQARVLVVDDDPSTLEAVRQLLEEAGYGVDTAANGRDALDLLADAPLPDVAIIDLMMPVMDGWKLAEELRRDARFETMPFVIVTAGGSRALSRAPVAFDYLTKPVAAERLLGSVRRAVERRRSAQ